MPKQKTHKGTKKRFRLSATGKAMHRSAGTSHLAARMSAEAQAAAPRHRRRRRPSKSKMVSKALCGNSY